MRAAILAARLEDQIAGFIEEHGSPGETMLKTWTDQRIMEVLQEYEAIEPKWWLLHNCRRSMVGWDRASAISVAVDPRINMAPIAQPQLGGLRAAMTVMLLLYVQQSGSELTNTC
jgi:hypothetical protein